MIDGANAFSSFAVKDLDAAERFYSQTLGLEVTKNEDMGLLQLAVGAGKPVMIYPKPDYTPATYTVLNLPVKDIDATVADLKDAGVEFKQYDTEQIKTDEQGIARSDGKGPDIAWFADPSGNIISVIGDASIQE
jgi:catechol 2,3-dioxygenase-like lactoylglutathione lyase family enzyme